MLKAHYLFSILLIGMLGAPPLVADEMNRVSHEEERPDNPPAAESVPGEVTASDPGPLTVREIEVTATLPRYPWKRVSEYRGYARERCVTCHEGLAEVSLSHPREFGCTVCHGGNGDAVEKHLAHRTLIYDPNSGTGKRNPSALTVVDKSCGQALCHAGHAQEDRNHVERVKKSMMATLAGVISGLRYQWAGQAGKTAKYGVRAIQDRDGTLADSDGSVARLEALPFFSAKQRREAQRDGKASGSERISRHIGDHLLRERCFQCHLDSPAPPGRFRSQGCAACHFTYSRDGRYQGKDPTISRTDLGHPAYHRMTALPPNGPCVTCHQSLDPEPASFLPNTSADSTPVSLFPAAGHIRQDVHLAKGFDCIDCHTLSDIMGDGNLYSKQHQAVEIRCETCHGDAASNPLVAEVAGPDDPALRLNRHHAGWTNSPGDQMVVSARNRKLSNVKVENGQIVVWGKRTGKKFIAPLVSGSPKAHVIPAHRSKLECTACHSQWVPRCTGCHMVNDQRKKTSPGDGGNWVPATFSFKAEEPVLMVGPRGKAAPMLPQPKRTLSVLDEQGKQIVVLDGRGDILGTYSHWEFTNPHGYSGANLVYALNPHSVGKTVRSCASCHLSPRALGLGEGNPKIGRLSTGKKDHMDSVDRSDIHRKNSAVAPDAKVTLRGEPLAGAHQPGARPFNQKEINRILRVGNCIPCHDRYEDPIFQNIEKSYAFEKTFAHRKLRARILNEK